MSLPKGSGMFIWQLARLGSPQNVADLLERAHIAWVNIKVQDGMYVSHGNLPSTFDQSNPEAYIEAIRAKGIKIHAWGYTYGNKYGQGKLQYAREVKAIIQAVSRFKPETFTINAEGETKIDVTPASQTAVFLDEVKASTDIPIGYTSYRFPKFHPEFPWELFSSKCDFSMPQVYWIGANNPAQQLTQCLGEYSKMSNSPVMPLGCAYPDKGWLPTPAQMIEFVQAVEMEELPAFSWWEMYYAATHSDWWNTISTFGEVVIPDPDPNPGSAAVIAKANNAIMNMQNSFDELKVTVEEMTKWA